MLGALAGTYPASVLAQRRAYPAAATGRQWLASDPWLTLAAVQQHLFPAGEATPGAADIGAAEYLRRALETPGGDRDDADFVYRGACWLNDLTRERFGEAFAALDETRRETALRDIEASRAGRRWLSLLLSYLLEALLADPVYAGNRGAIGWEWLEHQPGYPTPPPDKTWERLQARRYPGRKA